MEGKKERTEEMKGKNERKETKKGRRIRNLMKERAIRRRDGEWDGRGGR